MQVRRLTEDDLDALWLQVSRHCLFAALFFNSL